jgi:hypothetical protein
VSDELGVIIRESLIQLAQQVMRTGWRGREREAVSLYAFGFLVPKCQPGSPLHDPTQIGLDVAVGQLQGPNRKNQVCKDLVIWPKPAMVCWDETGSPKHQPIAILEWKARTAKVSNYDEEWLRGYSSGAPDFQGYAISLDPRYEATTLIASRVVRGVVSRDWLRYPAS